MKRWLLVLAACSPNDHPHWAPAGGNMHDGGTLHVATAQTISTLDPLKANDEVSLWVTHALFDSLVDYAPGSTTIVPRLATWDIAGTTYTFHLRTDLHYPDGTAIRAADVAYALSRAQQADDTTLAHEYVASIASIEARDLDLVIRLSAPDPAFLAKMALPFTTPQRADHPITDDDAFGHGPFALDYWDRGDVLRLVKRDRAHVDAIEIRESVPPDLAFLMFDRGELDIVDHLAIHDVQWFEAQPEWTPYRKTALQLATFGWRMDTRVPPFNDKRVRVAFNLADDKQHVIKLLGKTAVEAHGMLPPGIVGRDDHAAAYPYDPASARTLLREAHATDIDVTLVTYASDETERLAESFQADLVAIGVHATLDLRSFWDYQSALSGPTPPPLSLGAWQGDFPEPSAYLDAEFRSNAPGNNTGYANPDLDALLDARDYTAADALVHDDAPWVWEYHRIATEVVQPYVQDYAIHPVWVRDFTTLWLDLDRGERVSR